MRDMYEVMERWGAWAACDDNGVDWKSVAAGFKGLLPYGKKHRNQCNDDEGIMIDACVAKLKKYKGDEYELVIAHFVIGLSLRSIAKKRKCADGTIRKELQTALGFLEGLVCMLSEDYET
ncbi:antiterminator Q family protein [Cronobacter sakazakii]